MMFQFKTFFLHLPNILFIFRQGKFQQLPCSTRVAATQNIQNIIIMYAKRKITISNTPRKLTRNQSTLCYEKSWITLLQLVLSQKDLKVIRIIISLNVQIYKNYISEFMNLHISILMCYRLTSDIYRKTALFLLLIMDVITI